jgi:ArsR family transcriptional regulator
MSATTYEEETGVDESNKGGSPERNDANQLDPNGSVPNHSHSDSGTSERDTSERGTSNPRQAAERLIEAGADIADLVTVFKLLADETRLKILFILREAEEMNVLDLCGILGQRQPSVSHHLALLRVNGLIGMRRDGKHNFYRMRPSRLDEVVRTVLKVAPGRNGVSDGAQDTGQFSQADRDV